MFDGMSFDDINKLHSAEHKNISLPYDQYFGEMALTEAQIERRIETAKSLEDVFLFIASLMFYMVQADIMDYSTVYDEAASRYQSVIKQNNIENTAFFNEYHVPGAVSEIVNTTIQNPDRTFNYSYDRVMLIAENEANAIWNNAEFQEAIEEGFADKTWHAIIDKGTRDSHRYLDGKTIPIAEPFEVGEYLMMYPKDESFGAGMEEIAGCRCSVEYSGKSNYKPEEKSDIVKENVDRYIGKPIEETDNQHVREWYVANVSNIPYLIDKSGTIEMQAREAYALRNKFKHEARVAMSDRLTAMILETERPVKSFDELLIGKMERKGLSKEEAIADILATASKTNADVNKEFGL